MDQLHESSHLFECKATLENFYQLIVDDVVKESKQIFLDECVNFEVLQELKALWLSKLHTLKNPTKKENSTNASSNMTSLQINFSMQPPFELVLNVPRDMIGKVQEHLTQELINKLVKLPRERAQEELQSEMNRVCMNIAQVDGSKSDNNDDSSSSNSSDLLDSYDSSSETDVENKIDDKEEPLGASDDITDEEEMNDEDTNNLIVCQYSYIKKNKNKWKFSFSKGIMNINGEEFVFDRATGDAVW